MDKGHALPETLVNEILAYLGSRPYIEVARIIAQIGQAIQSPQGVLVPFPTKVEGEPNGDPH